MSFAKVFASIIAHIAQGTPIWKISAPASIHTTKSALDNNMDQFLSNGSCLKAYDQIEMTDDPKERIALFLQGAINPYIPWGTEKVLFDTGMNADFFSLLIQSKVNL
jgi:hypothetical protein